MSELPRPEPAAAPTDLEALVGQGLTLDRKRVHVLLHDLLELLDRLHTGVPPRLYLDLKPANVVFDDRDALRPRLRGVALDGTARPGGDAAADRLSPGYTAPERVLGDARPASDLYSLGMTMLFAVTRVPPFALPRRDGQVDPGAALHVLEPATHRVITRLIEPDLGKRYASARAALRELAGDFESSRSAGARGFFAAPLEVGGVSLFRIAVGVLLGAIVGYVLLAGAANRSVHPIRHRGLERGP